MRAQLGAGIGDLANVGEGAELHSEQTVAVNVLVQLPVFEQVVAAQRSAAFAPVARANVSAQGKIVVAFKAEDEELVEGDLAEGAAGAQLLGSFVIVSFDLRRPMPEDRAGQFLEGFLRSGPEARGLGCACCLSS
jgi:hypothetical protein